MGVWILVGMATCFAVCVVVLAVRAAIDSRTDDRGRDSDKSTLKEQRTPGAEAVGSPESPNELVKGESSRPGTTGDSLITPTMRRLIEEERIGLSPDSDGWTSEAFVQRAEAVLKDLLGHFARQKELAPTQLRERISSDFSCAPLRPSELTVAFRDRTITVRRADPATLASEPALHTGETGLVEAFRRLISSFHRTQPLQISAKVFGLSIQGDNAATRVLIELNSDGTTPATQIVAQWDCLWLRPDEDLVRLSAIRPRDYEEVVTRGDRRRWFHDGTASVLKHNPSFPEQLIFGLDYWLKRIERAHRMHVFAASGLAIGDANGDGLEDLYVCQAAGLPNRLFVQRQDGSADDWSVRSRVNWLESSSSALFLDLDNDGDQDLAIATLAGVLIMSNDSYGRFRLETTLPTGGNDMQSLSAADYDNDGDLDIYLCLNFPKAGSIDASETQFVYHNANDGAPNQLFRNEIRQGTRWEFIDVTQEVGLDVDNRRHSLAASWEDFDNDGDQDLYVANDYGQNCMYRNDEGKFVNVARQSGLVDWGSGMSVSWSDFNRDGRMDLYVGNMFSSAGLRITAQSRFRPGIDEATRGILQRFAKGNSLFLNTEDGAFREVGHHAAVEIARWAWSSIFLDINNSGWDDLFVANGYITTEDTGDL